MPPVNSSPTRLESSVSNLLLIAVFLAPLVFWSSRYFATESVKTLVIGVLIFAATLIACLVALKSKKALLPPKSIAWIGVLMALSIVVSSIASGHFLKSFFGQGFELGTGSLLITLLLSGLIAFISFARRADRVIVLYAGLFAAFILTWILQVLRLIVGPEHLTLGILTNVTSSLVGNWFSFGIFSAVIALISFAAIYFLRLSTKMRAAYWTLFALSALSMFVVNSREVWQAAALAFLGLTIYLTSQRLRPEGGVIGAFFRRLAWVPLIACAISVILAVYGLNIAGPIVSKMNAGYSELIMPWRMTLDIAAGELKESPFFGAGPNRFTHAYLAYKPAAINTTDAWGVEFNAGFGLIPTFLVTQGFTGGILWVLFFVFFGILGARSLRGLVRPGGSGDSVAEVERAYSRFVIISSYSGAAFLWIVSSIYVPSHAVVFIAFVLTGVWLASSVFYGRLRPVSISSEQGSRAKRAIATIEIIAIVVSFFWGLTYVKNAAALGYFGRGVAELNAAIDPVAADNSFSKAVSLYPLDIYWQARAEAGISSANKLLSTITATSTASTTSAVVAEAAAIVNKSIEHSNNAIAADPDNYNNYLSQARVAELATAMKMDKAYDSAVASYTNAIRRNQGNPSLYLSLARLFASQEKYDESIQAIGAALQVKSNYLDAVYLLSQVEAAKGNLADAVTAATFATQLNPENPLLFFQLGLLEYNKPDYAASATAFAQALKLNPAYANAQYFLGLAQARLGKTADAIVQFEALATANPDNTEVATILSTLRSGKSIFAAAAPSQAAQKRPALPIKQN